MIYNSIPITITEIKNGLLIKGKKEEKKPNFLITKYGEKIVRALIVGTAIEKFISSSGNYGYLVLNDELDFIRVKTFGDRVEEILNIDIGDIVACLGKVRYDENEKYIVSETIKKIDFEKEIFFKIQILKRLKNNEKMINYLKDAYEQLELEEFKDYLKEHFNFEDLQIDILLKNFGLNSLEEKILKIANSLKNFDIFQLSQLTNICEIDLQKILNDLLKKGKIDKVDNKYIIK